MDKINYLKKIFNRSEYVWEKSYTSWSKVLINIYIYINGLREWIVFSDKYTVRLIINKINASNRLIYENRFD